jgi:hypothetical protein
MLDKYDDKKQLVALPFGELEKIKYSKSQSLTEMIKEVNLDILLSPEVNSGRVFVDGVLINKEYWNITIPVEGSVVHIGVVPEGGDGGKIARSIAMIVVMAIAWWAGPAIGVAMFGAGTTGAGIAGGVIAAGIGIAGMLAVNALIPMPGTGREKDSTVESNSMLGINNSSRPYEPVQRLFGTHKFYPPYAIAPFTEVVGDKTIGYYVFCIGKGSYDLDAMKIGENALSNYSEYTMQQGFKDDIDIFSRGDINEENLAVNLTKADGPYTQTTQPLTTEISIDFACNALYGIYDGSGNVAPRTIQFNIEYRPESGGSWVPLTGSNPVNITRKTQKGFSVNFGKSGLAEDTYEIRVSRVTNDDDPPTGTSGYSFTTSSFVWSKLRSIKNTSPWTLDGVTLVALKIRLDGQINAGVDTFNLMVSSLLPAWNGSSWDTAIASRNPAWVYTEVLKGSSNRRAVEDEELDLTGLKSWADECTTKEFYFDGVIENRGTVYNLLRAVASVGRATPGRTVAGKYTVVRDIDQAVRTQLITPHNSWGFSGRKAFQDIPHALKCRFTNSEKDFLPDERLVYRSGYDVDNATLFETHDFPYITTPDHVWKLATYHLAQALLRPEIFNISMDFEHIANKTTRGSKVGFSYDAILVGLGSALVKSVSLDGNDDCTGITMNNSLTMEAGKTYGMNIRRSIDGRQTAGSIVLDLGEHKSITFNPVIPDTDVPAIGDLVNFGEAGLIDLDCMVQSIIPINDSDATLSLVEDAPAVRTADDGYPDSHDSKITHPGKYNEIPYAVAIENISIISQKDTLSILNQTGNITVAVDFSVDATSGVQPDSFQGQYYDQEDIDGEWISLPNILGSDSRTFEVLVQNGLIYDFRVRSVSKYGETSVWDTYYDYLVDYTDLIPNDITGLALIQGGTYWPGVNVEIIWNVPTDLWNVEKFRVFVYETSPMTLLRPSEYVDKNQITYSYTFAMNQEDNGGTPITDLTFRVSAISQTGEEGAYGELEVTNRAPGNVDGLLAIGRMGAVEFTWYASPDSDFKYFSYRLKVGTDAWSIWNNTTATSIFRILTNEEKDDHGSEASINMEIQVYDWFEQSSSVISISANCEGLAIDITDIDDIGVLSTIFQDVPVIQGLTFQNASPSVGYVAWSAHTIYLNGNEYLIAAGSGRGTYILWKDKKEYLLTQDVHPTDYSRDVMDTVTVTVNDITLSDGVEKIVDTLVGPAWHTTGSGVGAYIKIEQEGSSVKGYRSCSILAEDAGYTGIYSIQYSSNGSDWDDAVTDFAPNAAGGNSISWENMGAYKYWRLYLTTPGDGTWFEELEFFEPSTWKPKEDWIIATAINGNHQKAIDAIANQVIGSAWIQDLAVTNAKIQDLAVTNAKITSLDAAKITTGYLSANRIEAGSIVIGKLSDGVVNLIADAQAAADAAQSDATAAAAAAAAALVELDEIASDSKITPVEKLTIKPMWEDIVVEGKLVTGTIPVQAFLFGVPDTDFDTAFAALDTYIYETTHVFDSMTSTTTIVRADWDAAWKDYYKERTDLLNDIAAKAKELADAAMNAAAVSVFNEIFDDPNGDITTRWVNYQGEGEQEIIIDSGANVGGKLWKLGNNSGDDEYQTIYHKSIPFHSEKLYRIRCRLKRIAGIGLCLLSISGRNGADDGWVAYDGETNGTTGNYGRHAILSSEFLPPVWQTMTAYVKGRAATGSNIPHVDPDDPAVLHDDVRYFRPQIHTGRGDTATYLIDYFTVDIMPDSLDNIPDGITFGKVAGTYLSAGKVVISGDVDNHIVLDGFAGHIYINDETFGNKGIQADYNEGEPRFHVGNGSAEFFKYDQVNGVQISTEKENAITLKSGASILLEDGGSIKLEAGGDIYMSPSDTDPSKIIFKDSGIGTYDIEIQRITTNDRLSIAPTTYATCDFEIGSVGGSVREFAEVNISAYSWATMTASNRTESAGISFSGAQGAVFINATGGIQISASGGGGVDVSNWLKLAVLSTEPSSPQNGTMAICDGSGWQIISTRKVLVVWLDGAWIQIAYGAL